MKKNNRSFVKEYWSFSAALVVLVLFVSLVVAAYANRFGWFYLEERDSWGQFGDYVGGVINPLLSFCAFIGLIFTLRFQTAEAVKVEQRQNDQQFDSRLFQMLSLLNTSLSSVQIDRFSPAGMTSIVGHSAIKVGWRKLEAGLNLIDEQVLDAEFHTRFASEFRNWSDAYGDRMISYFDTLLFMLLYVRKQSDGENQKFALRAISSQLGQEARILLFYMVIFSGNKSMYYFLKVHNYWPGEKAAITLPHVQRLVKAIES